MAKYKIILASASPRRKELLNMLLRNFGLSFRVIPADILEDLPGKSLTPEEIVVDYAEKKARSIGRKNKGIIIGADTIVVLNRSILGKPQNGSEAKKMLKTLSGKKHKVYTGVSIFNSINNKIFSTYEKTKVTFRKINDKEIDFYIKTGSPMDKAGAYGIQDDFGSTFVSGIEGDYFNIVGLPVVRTYLGLKKFIDLGV